MTGPSEANGLATMLEALIAGNLDRDPGRRRLLKRGVVRLVARDAGVAATIRFVEGDARVVPGSTGDALVVVRASSADLLGLAAAPLRLGLPDALSPAGRAVLGRIVRGRIRIAGLVLHPILVSRFARLLSVV